MTGTIGAGAGTAAGATRRLGIFGGAFDPPHTAHVALARAALEQLALDELRVLPTGQAWHKPQELTPAHHRLAMARLAFGELPRAVVDDREMRRQGPTYTIDTLRELRAEQPGAQIFLVMGADQAVALSRWRDWPQILKIATISIAKRDYLAAAAGPMDPQVLALGRFAPLDLPPMDVSATAIRARGGVAGGAAGGTDTLVPGQIARYIEQHHLYQPT